MKISVGDKFGRWTVMGASTRTSYAICKCDCGTIKDIYIPNLTKGRTTSCGCYKRERENLHLPGQNLHDLTGAQFGEWTVLHRATNQNGQTMWHCRCSCGEERDVNAGRLKDGGSTSCGHGKFIDMTGQKIGHWTLLEKTFRIRPNMHACSVYKCQCDCGVVRLVDANSLIQGTSMSCGCVNSKGQEEITRLLQMYPVRFTTEVKFPDLYGTSRPLRFDVGILDDNDNIIGLIEYQGKQHYTEDANAAFGKTQREITDGMKKTYCDEKKIPLFEIRYDQNIQEQLLSILEVLHVNPVPSLSDEEGATTIPEGSTATV